MKYFPLLLIAAAVSSFLPGCLTIASIPQVDIAPINQRLVMPAHNRPIEVYYLPESLQKKPYAELAVITCNASGYVSESVLLERAREEARQLGADGIYVMDRHEIQQYDHLYATNSNLPITDRTVFRAIAIVHQENLADSIPYNEARIATVPVLNRYENVFVVKKNELPEINLYNFPEDLPQNVLVRINDSEPMLLLEKTKIAVYNQSRTLESHYFKVQYKGRTGYISGFDVVEQKQQ